MPKGCKCDACDDADDDPESRSLFFKFVLKLKQAGVNRQVKLHQVKCALSKKEKAAGFKDDYGVCDLAMEWSPGLSCTIVYDKSRETPDGGRMRSRSKLLQCDVTVIS